jgi:hypothetical protein
LQLKIMPPFIDAEKFRGVHIQTLSRTAGEADLSITEVISDQRETKPSPTRKSNLPAGLRHVQTEPKRYPPGSRQALIAAANGLLEPPIVGPTRDDAGQITYSDGRGTRVADHAHPTQQRADFLPPTPPPPSVLNDDSPRWEHPTTPNSGESLLHHSQVQKGRELILRLGAVASNAAFAARREARPDTWSNFLLNPERTIAVYMASHPQQISAPVPSSTGHPEISDNHGIQKITVFVRNRLRSVVQNSRH